MMQRGQSVVPLIAIFSAVMILGLSPASAQGPSLAGKTVNVIIGFGAGGGYDMWGRVVARHIGRHLPGNPTVVPQNMPGAGSFNAANHIYTVAPNDGTAIALITGDAALGPITGASGARFDPARLTWVGTPMTDTNICYVLNTPQMKVRTVKDVYETEVVVGSTGVGIGAYYYPKALSSLLGMKFKIVLGFPSSANVLLAMERGEVDGFFASIDSTTTLRPDWIADKKITILFQDGGAPSPLLKEVPFIADQAKTPDQRAAIEFLYAGQGLSRPFIAPPGMAPERVKMLRDAFMATMQDPEFLADAKRQKLPVDPKDGAYLAGLIAKIYATPKPIVDRVAELIK
jgi:tripartite-type tricarboxylate transporter receptor subunit TctC